MPKTIKMSLSVDSIDAAMGQINAYRDSLQAKCKLLCERLANLGMNTAKVTLSFAQGYYVGDVDADITVEEIENGYRVVASGETVFILEFGAGVRLGYGHPQADEFGMGPGTYPDGKGHWNDPNGWYLPGGHGRHSIGNPPGMMMYNAAKDIRAAIERTVREVFAADQSGT